MKLLKMHLTDALRFRLKEDIMGKTTGFLEFDRFVPEKRKPEERILDWSELKGHFEEEELLQQASRCMNCGVPFCQSGILLNGMVSGCPLHNLIPQWNDLVYRGKWEEAYQRLTRTNPFPEFTGRVCPAPCEGSCTEGNVTEAVTICNIEYSIIEKAFENNWVKPVMNAKKNKSIAVVGSGPAGLSAAWNLAIRGYQVTVFERQENLGGLLMYGIPNMKLDKAVIQRRIDIMTEMGIEFRCNVEIGKDIALSKLKAEFEAVVLAVGATKARNLEVPGNDANGVVLAVDYLKANTRNVLEADYTLAEVMNAKDKNVIVIGGGDTGTDCVGTAIRQGANTVVQFEITSMPEDNRDQEKNPWPEWPKIKKTDYGQEEAIHVFGNDPRIYNISTTDIVKGKDGNVTGLNTKMVEWKESNGRVVPVPVAGSEKAWDADLVLIAMGFVGPEATVISELSLAQDGRSNILADDVTYETSSDNIFVCGDARRGQSLVVWGIAEGASVAASIDKHLLVK